MAVLEIGPTRHWQILPSDVKPVGTDGSTVHIITTGETYVYHDGTWEPDRRVIYAIQQANL